MKLSVRTVAVVFSLFPSFSRCYSHSYSPRRFLTMTSSKFSNYKPVDIYPYNTNVKDIQAQGNYKLIKKFHIVRHAEGTHNVNKEYKDIIKDHISLDDELEAMYNLLNNIHSRDQAIGSDLNKLIKDRCLRFVSLRFVRSSVVGCRSSGRLFRLFRAFVFDQQHTGTHTQPSTLFTHSLVCISFIFLDSCFQQNRRRRSSSSI